MQSLIADDDAISRRLAKHALTGCGAEVAVAEDGHAAWSRIQERTQSTVLILDRQMPGIDGVDLCRRARLLPSFPPLYIVMVTSASETADITAGLDAGADDYVCPSSKPPSPTSNSCVDSCRCARTARRFEWTTGTGRNSRDICRIIQTLNSATASARSVSQRCLMGYTTR